MYKEATDRCYPIPMLLSVAREREETYAKESVCERERMQSCVHSRARTCTPLKLGLFVCCLGLIFGTPSTVPPDPVHNRVALAGQEPNEMGELS